VEICGTSKETCQNYVSYIDNIFVYNKKDFRIVYPNRNIFIYYRALFGLLLYMYKVLAGCGEKELRFKFSRGSLYIYIYIYIY